MGRVPDWTEARLDRETTVRGTVAEPLPRSTLLWYGAPMSGFMLASMPITLWFGKFSTDTLLIPAAAMGFIVMAARLWDGISDPLVGYLSDRTKSERGRRGAWMRASAIPMAITLIALWSPPAGFGETATIIWMAVAYLLWETASTALLVPYGALGYELTTQYHERTRIFAWRHLASVPAYGGSLGLLYLLRTAAEESPAESRAMATQIALFAGGLLALVTWMSASRVPEPAEHQGRGAVSVFSAFGDVFRNPHARILSLVFLIEAFGIGSISFLSPYVVEDVLGNSDVLETVLACWMIPQFLLTPLWLKLSKRLGKKRLWLAGMSIYSVAFGSMWWIAPGREWLVFSAVIVLGVGGGISAVMAPSVQADVVDYDEHQTGDRKEGSYTAVWNLLRKSGWGLTAGMGGIAMGMAGYDGALDEQAERTKTVILALASLLPCLAYAFGALYFSRFSLNEQEHSAIRAEIDERD